MFEPGCGPKKSCVQLEERYQKMRHTLTMIAFVVGALGLGGMAQASPYFQFTNGVQETQPVIGSGNFIPVGATGFDSLPGNALEITLQDPGHTGESRTIRLDYIGSDAGFTNEFSSGSVMWCNQTSGCQAGYDPIGVGNQDWYTNFARTAYITMNVGDYVPLNFLADLYGQGGNGSHTLGNPGPTSDGAHFGAFMWNNGTNAFETTNYLTTGSVFGLGLTDGFYDPTDNDHQDLTLKISVVPEPGSLSLALLGLAGLALVRRRRKAR